MFVFRMKRGFHWRVVGFTRFNFKSVDCFLIAVYGLATQGQDIIYDTDLPIKIF